MSEVFEGYERQYCEASASLSRKCTAASALDGEKKKQKLSEIQSGVEEAESLIRKMDLEARNLQPSIKAGLLAKLREYKSDLNNVKSELKRISAPNARQATREELLESGMADTLAVSTDQRGRLMMTTERLNQSTDRIKESRRTMLETEELGVSILQDLHQQRQSLLHAHTTVCTCLNSSTYYIDLISGFLIFSGCKAAIILANRTSITALIVNFARS
ncbi:vesicle transport v-SNARE 13 isoform X1 [Zea mays]|uniref:vesicle transport v-SNARE 13 isoform X1 n=1 Tax=Zea mays TaxID=4577 RepID=UPI001651C055|nr:vesicle transport v-SNARE 13 isoform X1 [Zea mays]